MGKGRRIAQKERTEQSGGPCKRHTDTMRKAYVPCSCLSRRGDVAAHDIHR